MPVLAALLVSNPLGFMRKRDLLIVAGLLVIAVVALALFARSWMLAGRVRDRRPPSSPPPPPPDSPPAPPPEVSKTRGYADPR